MPATNSTPAERLRSALLRVIELRERLQADTVVARRWHAVKRWQSRRLENTYEDLLESPRYGAACRFFLDELYGVRDFAQRDREALRVVPKLARLLPERAVATMAHGVELDGLSETLDARIAEHLRGRIDAESYCKAYVEAGTRAEREQQIATIGEIGGSLERLARVPLLSTTLHMMRGPAEAAGLGHLHRFLATGFDAFQSMGAARTFLDAVRTRETTLMERVFEGVVPEEWRDLGAVRADDSPAGTRNRRVPSSRSCTACRSGSR